MIDAQTKLELDRLIALGKKYKFAPSDIHLYLQEGGVLVEPALFYSSIPMIKEIQDAFEYREDAPFAVDDIFDIEAARAVIAEITPFSKEFSPPQEGDSTKPAGYFWKNNMFSYSDAMSYYAMIRRLEPKTIIEIGSGFSTLVAREAVRRNGAGKIVCIEPFPRPWLREMEDVELIERPAQSFAADFFNDRLADGDILFIDSTHTVKTGSDCLHLYLRVLPRLRHDLAIHVHDVFLPYGMPLKWEMDMHIHWTEQYLLLAYMIANPRTRLLFGSNFAHKKLPVELEAFMHGHYAGGGGSFWFRQAPEGSVLPAWDPESLLALRGPART